MKFVKLATKTLRHLKDNLHVAMVQQRYENLADYYKQLKLVEYMIYGHRMSVYQHDILRKLSELDRFSPNEQYLIYKMYERTRDILGDLEDSEQSPTPEPDA